MRKLGWRQQLLLGKSGMGYFISVYTELPPGQGAAVRRAPCPGSIGVRLAPAAFLAFPDRSTEI